MDNVGLAVLTLLGGGFSVKHFSTYRDSTFSYSMYSLSPLDKTYWTFCHLAFFCRINSDMVNKMALSPGKNEEFFVDKNLAKFVCSFKLPHIQKYTFCLIQTLFTIWQHVLSLWQPFFFRLFRPNQEDLAREDSW